MIPTTQSPAPGELNAADAALVPGDALQVRIWREEDLTGTFQVGDQGIVVLPLLGRRRVEGVAAADLERQIAADYAGFLENPSIEVTALRRISILGEVRSPGLYQLDGTITLTEAFARAGGVTRRGDPGDLRIVRHGSVIAPTIRDGMILESLPLRSGDQIVVGRRSWIDRNLPLFGLGVGAIGAAVTAIFVAGG